MLQAEVETICSHCRLRRVNRRTPQTRSASGTAPQTVGPETIQRLLSGITDLRDRALFSLLATTGLRAGEIQHLHRSSIHIEQHSDAAGNSRSVGIGKITATKSGTTRIFFLDQVALIALQEYLESREDRMEALFLWNSNRSMDGTAIRARLSYWCSQIGIPQINPYELRHAFAIAMANAGIEPFIAAELLGCAYRGAAASILQPNLEMLLAAYLTAIKLLRPR